MPSKSTKAKKSKSRKNTQNIYKSAFCHPSTWLIVILAVALVAVCSVAASGFQTLGSSSRIDSAKLAVFNDLAETYIRENDVTDNGISEIYQMTGYGISDEDGVFYITFDFADPTTTNITISESGTPILSGARHGIMYFWPSENSTSGFSHAYSYHDDDYRPSGEYYKI